MHVAQTCEAKFKHGNASSTSTNKREVRREEGRGKAWSWRNRHPNAPAPTSLRNASKEKVRFEEPEDNGAVEVDEDVLNQDDEGQQQSLGNASGSSSSPQQCLQDIGLVDWN